MWEDDHPQDGGGLRAARPGPHLHRRRGRHPAHGLPTEHRVRLPELRPLSSPDRVRERRLRPPRAPDVQRAGSREGRTRARPRRPAGLRAAIPQPALGRRATARGRRARRRRRASAPALRRAALEPRREATRPDARRALAAPEAARHHHRLCHPRPGRSHGHLGPDRRDAPGHRGPARHGRGPVSRAALGLRGPVHRPRQPRRKPRARRQRGTGRRRGVGIAPERGRRRRVHEGSVHLPRDAPRVHHPRPREREAARGRGHGRRYRAEPNVPR